MNVRLRSSKVQWLPRKKNKLFPADKWVRTKALRTAYYQTQGPEPQRITAKGTKNFAETLKLFRKLERANPKRVEPRSLVQDMLSMLNQSHPSETGTRNEHFL